MNVGFYLSYVIKITLKSHFCSKDAIIYSLCMQHCYECPNVVMDVIMCPKNLVDYRFHCQALFHSQRLCRDNMRRFGFLAVLVEIMYNILIYLRMALNKWNP